MTNHISRVTQIGIGGDVWMDRAVGHRHYTMTVSDWGRLLRALRTLGWRERRMGMGISVYDRLPRWN